jgi:hypothetical protein
VRLGASFLIDRDVVLVEEVDPDGSVVAAGGKTGDRWLTIDGSPAVAVVGEWESGLRARRPGVPLTVEALRDGRPLTMRPMWRSDVGASAPEQVKQSDRSADARDEAAADTTTDAASPMPEAFATLPEGGDASMPAPTNWLRVRSGRPPLHPELADALRQESEFVPHRPYDAFRQIDDAVDQYLYGTARR